ncbi:MAG TPA: hypothetical protein VJ001_14925 [Rhodocyclaceae bacterium]|nr:hypothetical protein [Rhodocyclaceae bacterium]
MMKRFALSALAVPLFALAQLGASTTASAQLGNLGGLGNLLSGSSATPSAPAAAESGSSAAATYKHTERKFHFTIPAGWAKVSGELNADSMIFRKVGTTRHFQFHSTAMAASFPAETSVSASLNSAKQDVKLGKNLAAKRRDDKCESNPKQLCARGWELIDNGESGPQRIIWQAYDKSNTLYNFMASAEKAEFADARAELQTIVDSIKFE